MYTHKHIKSLRASKEKEKKTYTSIKINRNYSEQRMKIYCAFNILHGYCCHCYYYFYKCCHEFNILNWHLLSCLILFLQMYSWLTSSLSLDKRIFTTVNITSLANISNNAALSFYPLLFLTPSPFPDLFFFLAVVIK